jgi:hypothetical protein
LAKRAALAVFAASVMALVPLSRVPCHGFEIGDCGARLEQCLAQRHPEVIVRVPGGKTIGTINGFLSVNRRPVLDP